MSLASLNRTEHSVRRRGEGREEERRGEGGEGEEDKEKFIRKVKLGQHCRYIEMDSMECCAE